MAGGYPPTGGNQMAQNRGPTGDWTKAWADWHVCSPSPTADVLRARGPVTFRCEYARPSLAGQLRREIGRRIEGAFSREVILVKSAVLSDPTSLSPGDGPTLGVSLTSGQGVTAPDKVKGEMPRVVIADDDRGFREMLRDLLEDEGFHVIGEAEDGAAGVALAAELRPDVVLMDLRMPNLGGIAAAAKIKGILPTLQVLILTAYDDPGLNRAAADVGVYCYLVKGCSVRLLKDMLLRAWGYKRELEGGAVWPSTAR
jgi:CheY-like chemotaxis protein